MKALVLGAGFGRRLGELTESCPKPLLSLGRETIAEHILSGLARAGIVDVFLNVHHLAEQFPARLGDGSHRGVRLHYVPESAPKGTAGTPRDLAPQLGGEDLLVHYGDIVHEHNLAGLVALHRHSRAQATILVHQRAGSNSFAYFANDSHIDRFVERPNTVPDDPRPSFVFSGVCVLSNTLLAQLPVQPVLDLPADVFPGLAAGGALAGQRLAGRRWAIDSPQRLAMARRALEHTPP